MLAWGGNIMVCHYSQVDLALGQGPCCHEYDIMEGQQGILLGSVKWMGLIFAASGVSC